MLTGATALGAAPSSQKLHVALNLRLRNEAQLDQFITSLGTPGNPAFGTKLSADQMKASYLPTSVDAQTVVNYLDSAGFTNIKVAGNNLIVEADGTVAVAEAAFNTPIAQYLYKGETVFANTQTLAVPASLNGLVTSVHGLQNAIRMRPFHNKSTRLPGPVGMSANGRLSQRDAIRAADPVASTQVILPQYLAVTYDVQSVPPNTTVAGAIFMSGDLSGVESDLRLAEMEANLPVEPVTITITGGTTVSGDSGADEWDLDSQSSQGGAGNFKEIIWYDSADGSLATALNQWVMDDRAPSMSASIGFCEVVSETPAGMEVGLDPTAVDAVLKTAVAQGKTFFASTGDNGSFCAVEANGQDAGVPSVEFPASSQYAVGVGGTTVNTFPGFTYGSEAGWTESGGGISNFEPSPSWQTGVIPAATVPSVTGGGRALPDISADGDPGSGAFVIVNGAPEAVGGTSLSAPLSMGLWSRMQAANGGTLGFAAPLLYALYAKGTSASYATSVTGLHDITTGNNGLYSAGAGYDNVTGMGSFDVCVLTGLLKGDGTNYCTTPATPVVNTAYPNTTTTDTCTVPGMTLNVTPGASELMQASQTITSIQVSEPADKPGFIVFTINVSSLSTLPPNTAWQVLFDTPTGEQYYVQMDTYDAGGAAEFFYGGNVFDASTSTNTVTNIGSLDASSNYTPAGVITLVAPESDFGGFNAGGELTYIFSDVTLLGGAAGVGLIETLQSTSVSLYTVRSSNFCTAGATTGTTTGGTTGTTMGTTTGGTSGGITPLPTITQTPNDGARLGGGGAFGGLILGPLAVLALLRRRRRRSFGRV